MSDIAINPVTRRVQFTGNTGTGPYAFTFNVLQSSDIVVYKNNVLLTETTDYTVSIATNGTGNITMVVALVLTDILTIIGGRELSRTTDFVTAGDLLASSLNEQLDSNVIMSQQLDERFGRTLAVPPGDEDKTLDLPLAADRADKIILFDTEGNVTAAPPSDFFGNAVLGGNFIVNTATGDGSQTAFGLTVAPGVKTNIQIHIDGVYQNKATFSLSGSTVTFTEAPPLNAAIEFMMGESVTQITGDASAITYNQGGTGAQDRTVQSKLQDFVSVKDFGAVGDGVADDYTAIAACWTHCLANAVGMYFPSGTYIVNDLSFPMGRINGLAPSSLLDCKNVTIFGDGRSTILKTVSSAGADVLQFNGAKNLHVKDLSITADLTGSAGAGSNCVSLTGGADNITFENVYAFNPDYVEKVAYLDGGKGFTIQMTSITPERGTITFTNCIADGCVYGFDINPTIDDILSKKTVTRIDACIAENCWYGFIASTPAATASVPSGFDQGIVIDGTAINCQHTFTLGRVHGGDYSINVVNSKSKANLKLDPSGSAWSASLNTTVDVFTATYAYNALISITGYAATVDNKAQVGGTTGGTVTGYTFQSKMYIDIGGTSDVSDFTVVDSGGNSINNCDVYVTNRTTSSALPSTLYTSAYENTVTKGSQKKFHDPLVDGSLGFVYTDGITTHNTIERDGLGLFAKQVGGSSNDIPVFGVKDNTGNKDFVVFNNGGIYSASAATATSAATIKKVLIFYDSAGAIDGYIPIYTSYS